MRVRECASLRVVGAFVLVAAVYIAVSFSLRKDAFFVGDMGVKFVQVESLLRSGFRSLALEYPGAAFDPEAEFYPFRSPSTFKIDGRVYSTFPPAFCALSALPYRFLGCRGLYVIPLLAGLGTVLVTYFIAVHLRVRRPECAMLLVGLGTPLCFYSLLFWEHTLAAFLFALSLLFAVRAFHVRRIQNVAWCGVFAGAAPWFRTEMLLALAAMACAFAVMAPTWRIRVLVLAFFSVGAGLLGIPLVIFNLRAYGGLFGAHYLQNIQLDQAVSGGITWFGTLWVKLDVLSRHLLFGREFFNVRGNDVLVFAPFVAAILLWLAPRFAWKRVAQAVILCLAAGVGVYVALTSATVVGFFAASPAMVLAFAGANPIRLWRGRIAFRARGLSFCVLVCGIYALFLFATSPVLGGVQFGPRFLLPLYVPAALLAARTATPPGLGPGWTRRLSFVSGLVLVACSSMMGARGMIFAHQQKAIAGYVKDTIAQTDCRIVVSDMQILALTGPIYFDRIMFCAPDEQALRRLETLLSGRGERLFLFVTRSVKPVGPVGITVAAANAPEVPVMRAGEVRFILGPIEGLGEVLSAGH